MKIITIILLLLTLSAPAIAQRRRTQEFAIFSPILGLREDAPSITIPEAFTVDNSNVVIRYGEIHRALMRSNGSVVFIESVVFFDGGSEAPSLNDASSGGTYTGVATQTYRVQIDTEATPDTFSWSDDGTDTWDNTGVAITGSAQTLEDGVTIAFLATTGHDTGDYWLFKAVPAELKFNVTPDANPILNYHWLEKSDGTDFLLAYTKANVYSYQTVATIGTDVFVGSGLDDGLSGGTYSGTVGQLYRVQVDGNPGTDTFSWSDDGTTSWDATGVAMTGSSQTLEDGVTITFTATTGHTIGDYWIFGAAPDKGWLNRFVCTADCTEWSTTNMNDAVLSTNNVDFVQTWTGSERFANLDHASGLEITASSSYVTKAKWITSFANYAIVGNVEITSATLPQSIYWSDTELATEWETGNAGDLKLLGPDPLQGSKQISDFLMIFSSRSIDALWAVPSTLVFNSRRVNSSIGTYAPGSIVRDVNENIFFLDNQKNIRAIQSVMSQIPVVSAPVELSLKKMPDTYISNIKSTYVKEYGQIWWAIPGDIESLVNDKVLILDDNGAWTTRAMPVNAFGEYEEKTSYTWDTLPFDSWDEWGWSQWDTVESKADYRLDIVADNSGNSFIAHNSGEDAGSEFTGYAVLSTDFSTNKGSVMLGRYKRLIAMTVFFRNEGQGSATIEIKRDTEPEWQSVGTASLSGSGEYLWNRLTCDLRARQFQFKVSGTDPFRFLGVIFYYVPERSI